MLTGLEPVFPGHFRASLPLDDQQFFVGASGFQPKASINVIFNEEALHGSDVLHPYAVNVGFGPHHQQLADILTLGFRHHHFDYCTIRQNETGHSL